MMAAVTDVERRSAAVVDVAVDAACVIVGEGTGTVVGRTW
jgi:hypothetical protein